MKPSHHCSASLFLTTPMSVPKVDDVWQMPVTAAEMHFED